jgi:YggT family protein
MLTVTGMRPWLHGRRTKTEKSGRAVMQVLFRVIGGIIDVVVVLIIIDVIASWIPPLNRHALIQELRRVTDPVLTPFRLIVPPERLGIDVSPILAILVLQFIARAL